MYAKIGNFIDVNAYKESFESNLNKDEIAKDFWARQIPILILKFAAQALESETQQYGETVKTDGGFALRVERYKREYQENVDLLMENKDNFLSVRILLELNEQLLKKHGFTDVWMNQKTIENSKSLGLLHKRLKQIDQIEDSNDRWEELFRGVLAGNIFDSGATQVQEILKDNQSFGLNDALNRIQDRPWLIDSFDQFMARLKNGPPHNCSAFFCDNSGVDIVLGVIPFVRELLKRHTRVILCANSEPSLNDVTCQELVGVVEQAAEICQIIKENYRSNNLIVRESGQKGCCLNFLNIDDELVDAMLKHKVDLIVIEGMGRGLHTNLNSKFKCESLKLAVIKNKFLASRLGGNLFDAICKYENSST